MGIIAFVVIGWVVGVLAGVAIPDPKRTGLIAMSLVGMVGSIVGTILVGSFDLERPIFSVRPLTLVGSVVGALVAVVVVANLNRKKAHA